MTRKHRGMPNIPFPTLGGQQLWLDRVFYDGWRIQKNVITGHHRVLSARNVRKAWGSYAGCLKALEVAKDEAGLLSPSNHLALLIHGMAGFPETFFRLKKHLRQSGYYATSYNYPSLVDTLGQQADDLNFFLDQLQGVTELTLIGHSQGGTVIRKALEIEDPWRKRIELKGIVMVGTPNQGAALAEYTKRVRALNKIAPKVRDQLTKSYAKTLKVPGARIGLIAGSLMRGRGVNPLVPGDDDGIVGVEEVWIHGVEERLVVSSDHFTLANRKKSREAIVRFIEGNPLAG